MLSNLFISWRINQSEPPAQEPQIIADETEFKKEQGLIFLSLPRLTFELKQPGKCHPDTLPSIQLPKPHRQKRVNRDNTS